MENKETLKMIYKFDENEELELAPIEAVENADCEEVLAEEIPEIKKLGEAMIRLCVEKSGLGLAAPQVGVMKRMFVWMNGSNTFQIVLNPAFFPDKKTTHTVEGCLTYPEQQYYMTRFKSGNARFEVPDPKDPTKLKKVFRKLSGERALVFQHELDHTQGNTIAMKGELMNWKKTEDAE